MRTVTLLSLALFALLIPAQARAAAALTVNKTEQLTPRLQQLTMRTTAVVQDVRLLLPPGYDTSNATCYPAIIVMPYGGIGSEYADWRTGQERWETFHIKQLLPYIDASYRTIADRAHRAITGFSMGGLGTMRYATRHPDLFSVAAPMSGAVSLVSPVGQAGVAVNEGLELLPPGSIFGDLATQEVLLGHVSRDRGSGTRRYTAAS